MRSCSERGVTRELLEVPLTKPHPGTPRRMQFVRMELSTFQLLPQVPKLLILKPWKSAIFVSLECFKLGLALQISLLKIYRLHLCLGFNPAPLSHAFRIESRMEQMKHCLGNGDPKSFPLPSTHNKVSLWSCSNGASEQEVISNSANQMGMFQVGRQDCEATITEDEK